MGTVANGIPLDAGLVEAVPSLPLPDIRAFSRPSGRDTPHPARPAPVRAAQQRVTRGGLRRSMRDMQDAVQSGSVPRRASATTRPRRQCRVPRPSMVSTPCNVARAQLQQLPIDRQHLQAYGCPALHEHTMTSFTNEMGHMVPSITQHELAPWQNGGGNAPETNLRGARDEAYCGKHPITKLRAACPSERLETRQKGGGGPRDGRHRGHRPNVRAGRSRVHLAFE
jgi:hypothetical protein